MIIDVHAHWGPWFFTMDVAEANLATMDRYDGMVWGATDNALPEAADDSFQRVSSTIDNPVEGREVDAYWPDHRLAVELDSRRYHQTTRNFESDRQRDVILLKPVFAPPASPTSA